jgi:hypothetical protein
MISPIEPGAGRGDKTANEFVDLVRDDAVHQLGRKRERAAVAGVFLPGTDRR